MGAVGEAGILVVNDDVVRIAQATQAELDEVARRERDTLERSVRDIRSVRPRLDLRGCAAVIVDDGIATGATMRAAVRVARADSVESVIVATPVAPPSVATELEDEADAVVCVVQPEPFGSVGRWYRHFGQVGDHEVIDLLRAAMARTAE